jgi:hypothetical protein
VRISRGGLLVCFSVVAGLLVGPTLIPGQKSETASAALVTQDEPAKDATRRTFRLTVNGPDGKPVPNANCEIRRVAALKAEQILEGTFVKNGAYGTLTQTNEKGELAISLSKEISRLSISIKQSGFGPFWATWDTSDGSSGVPDDATVALDNAWSVGAIVLDEAGAPLDEFRADICRPGGFQLSYQSLIAREEEYVFSPPPALVISGKVIDAVTKEPVLRYRVVPGTHDEPRQRPGEHWNLRDSYSTATGKYSIQRTNDAPVHRLRIEALGYKVATSRDIKMDEGTVEIDFELEPAKIIAPVILTPGSKPASFARIAVGVVNEQITIRNGEIRENSTYATKLTANADGSFSIPERSERYQIVIMHPEGFARLVPREGHVPETISLTAWARAEGTFQIARQPVPNVNIAIRGQRFNILGEDDELRVWIETSGRTNAEGQYTIDRIFPAKCRTGREITYMVKDGATEVTSSQQTPVEYISGETTRVDFGDSGRPVVGKLIAPEGHPEPVIWGHCRLNVESNIPKPAFPQPPADLGDDNNAYNVWFTKWLDTPEGGIWTADYKAVEAELERQPNYHASIDRDGSFRIDDMLPGKYVVKMRFHDGVEGMLPERIFEVPIVANEDITTSIDLGELRMIAIE